MHYVMDLQYLLNSFLILARIFRNSANGSTTERCMIFGSYTLCE